MWDKLHAAFLTLKQEVEMLRISVARLDKVRAIAAEGKPGRDGKDGISPSIEAVVEAVLSQMPPPEKIDTKSIINEVMSSIPKPRDGRDALPVNVSDVAAIVLAKIPKPKDGKDGPDLEAVIKRFKAQVRDGQQGEPGPPGPPGKDGTDGVSVTDVQLNNNDLFVFLDGKKRKAGTVKFPVPSAPFNPGSAGGGGSARSQQQTISVCQISITFPVDPADARVSVAGTGDTDLQPPAGFVPLLNAYQEILTIGPTFSVLADGRILINRDSYIQLVGYADVFHSSNNTTGAVTFVLERDSTLIYTNRSVHARLPSAGDIGNLSGNTFTQAQKGDILGVAFASNTTGDITVRTSTVVFSLVQEL